MDSGPQPTQAKQYKSVTLSLRHLSLLPKSVAIKLGPSSSTSRPTED